MINRFFGELQSNIKLKNVQQFDIGGWLWSAAEAAAADTDGIIDGGVCSASLIVILAPDAGKVIPCPRNVTATAGGTATDIKAVQVTIYGTNAADEVISEQLSAFTVDTAGIVTGAKAFKTITKVEIPAMDGTGATVDIGWGEKLGMPFTLDHNSVLYAVFNHVKEATVPTVAYSATALESNTIDINTALDGHEVEAYFIV